MNKIYLDNAATTAIAPEVIDVITNSMASIYGNPSSTHQFGRTAKSIVENARKSIAKRFNVTASEIVFTSGGSEADNLILWNAVTNLGVTRIISSRIEHHAVLHTIEMIEKDLKISVEYVNVNEEGCIDLIHLEELLSENNQKTLVSLMYVNNEIGTILDVKKVCELCKTNNALFHSDAVQAVGHYALDLQETPIDFIVASAHKFHGPKGVGFAYFKKGFGIKPILTGGEQERGARAGTENVHSILGMEKALELVYQNLDADIEYISGLKNYFMEQLSINIPKVIFNGIPANSLESSYSILNVRFPVDSPMLLFSLDLKGIAASGGSACQSGSNTGSHVLNAILSEKEAMKTSVRFSFSKHNTTEEIDSVLGVLIDVLKK
ncbi:cysteine desulfurase family protein [Urechidicola croceus]|uniref:cysteine desulfurase n=1 Tax=Urechidicola croceus TaxID=1850246 RepID=A0A1D8P4U3_9FLAO|nr:cysteine desulfurase family protein [Urechidicola croceus]AOW19576.1 cysteine desulfurase [Urechidicola croceus]